MNANNNMLKNIFVNITTCFLYLHLLLLILVFLIFFYSSPKGIWQHQTLFYFLFLLIYLILSIYIFIYISIYIFSLFFSLYIKLYKGAFTFYQFLKYFEYFSESKFNMSFLSRIGRSAVLVKICYIFTQVFILGHFSFIVNR